MVFSVGGSGQTPSIIFYSFQVRFQSRFSVLGRVPSAFLLKLVLFWVVFFFRLVWIIKNSFNRNLRPKASMFFFSWNLFTLSGIGAYFNPLDSKLTSSGDRSTPERFTTVQWAGLLLSTVVGGAQAKHLFFC